MDYNEGYVLNGDYQEYTGDLISGETYYVFDENSNKYVVTLDTQRQTGVTYYKYVIIGPSLYLSSESDFGTDFIGFSYKGVHCSELNFWRTSDGSRYDETVIPNFSDTTAQMPGHDGILYWESFDSNRTFQIPIAFDSMNEVQYRRFRQVFNGKDYGDLIFDEAPYKRYSVKVQSPPQLKTICFMEDGQRVYKGEGSIVFVAYYPYARQVYKFLDSYSNSNKDEWALASGMLSTKGSYDTIASGSQSVPLYNAGDLPADWKLCLTATSLTSAKTFNVSLTQNSGSIMGFTNMIKESGDDYIRINSATNLIEGLDSNYKPTGKLYNKYLTSGDFFKIPLGEDTMTVSSNVKMKKIEYDYLYY